MDRKLAGSWYLTRPGAISQYLVSVIKNWGYPVFWNREFEIEQAHWRSGDSESVYLKVCLGSRESPKALRIRISNHSVAPENLWVVFNFDVYCGYEREGAISYVKLLSKLAEKLDKPLPPVMEQLKTGTEPYKHYRIEMQRRKKLANGRQRFFEGERLYV